MHIRDLGGPTPLLVILRRAAYEPRLRYKDTIQQSSIVNANRKAFSRALQREIAFRFGKDTAWLHMRRMGPWTPSMMTPKGKAFYPSYRTYRTLIFSGRSSRLPSGNLRYL
jgi:hypothetical protein